MCRTLDHCKNNNELFIGVNAINGTKATVSSADIVQLLGKLEADGIDFVKIENLYEFNGERGYSLGQGETAYRFSQRPFRQ